MRSAPVFVVAALMMVGCSSEKGSAPDYSGKVEKVGIVADLRGPYWYLESMPGQAVPSDRPPFLLFSTDTNRLSGNTGVNSLGGEYRANGTELTFSKIFTTKMAAVDPARNALESSFLKALEGRNIPYKVAGGKLTFGGMTFGSHDAAPGR